MSVKSPRQLNCRLDVETAVPDIVSAIVCNLALRSKQITNTLVDDLIDGCGIFLSRAVNGRSMQGKVPIALYQLAEAISPGELELFDGATVVKQYKYDDDFNFDQIRQPNTVNQEGFSEFLQSCSQIGGPMMDLNDLGKVEGVDVTVGKKKIRVQFKGTMGPMGLADSTNDNPYYGVGRFQQKDHVSQKWMRYLGWIGNNLDLKGATEVTQSDYYYPPNVMGVGYQVWANHPGRILLTRALSDLGVLQVPNFKFTAVLVSQAMAWLDADFTRRGLAVDKSFIEQYAMMAIAKVAVASSGADFISAMLSQPNCQLPEVINESFCMGVYQVGTVLRVPVVITNVNPKSKYRSFSGAGYVVATAWPSGFNYAGLFGNTFDMSVNGKFLKDAITGDDGPPAWGALWTAADQQDYTATKPTKDEISDTVSRGPLCQAGSDPSMGRLNMNAVGFDSAIKQVAAVGEVNGYYEVRESALNCYFSSVKTDDQLRLLSVFCLALDNFAPTTPGEEQGTIYCPKFRNVLQVEKNYVPRAQAYSLAAVTEASAKYTAVQNFIEDLNTRGLGGNSLLGYLGTAGRYAGKALAIGVHPVLGKAVEVLGIGLEKYAGQPGNNSRGQRQMRRQGQGRGNTENSGHKRKSKKGRVPAGNRPPPSRKNMSK